MIPSGAIDDWRQQSEGAGDLLGRHRLDDLTVQAGTRPRLGFSIRDSARRSVDLPQAFGPTITVKELSGISTDNCSAMTRWS
ncbi:hypothetical protein SHIRM173S_06512 [Streptomyces hirsutus]